MNGCDDESVAFEVSFHLPVTVRVWAVSHREAVKQATRLRLFAANPTVSTGFPTDIKVKDVEKADAANS